MNAIDKEKVDMNTRVTTNKRLVTILIVLLIILLILLIIGLIVVFLMMGGGMGMNGQTMNAMISACNNMMQNFQHP